MKEYIKSNNLQSFSNKIKVYDTLPNSGIEDEVVFLKNDGIYQYKNNNWNKLINTGDITGVSVPVGIISASTTIVNDSDWLLCDGSVFDTSVYPELYNILGSNTLPDLRGRFLIGQGQNTTDTITNHDSLANCAIRNCGLEVFQAHSHSISNMCHNHTIEEILDNARGISECIRYTCINGSHNHSQRTRIYCTNCSISYSVLCQTSLPSGYCEVFGVLCNSCGGVCDANSTTEVTAYGDYTAAASTCSYSLADSTTNTSTSSSSGTVSLVNKFQSYSVNFYVKAK